MPVVFAGIGDLHPIHRFAILVCPWWCLFCPLCLLVILTIRALWRERRADHARRANAEKQGQNPN